MVAVTDGIGRCLYVIDGNDRLHPYTYEKVDGDFEFKYPSETLSISIWPFILLAIISIVKCLEFF